MESEIRKYHCSRCNGERNCNVLFSHKEDTNEEWISFWVRWSLLKCCGCDFVFLRQTVANSEHTRVVTGENGEDHEEPIEQVTYWPALTKREVPDWLIELDVAKDELVPLTTVMRELYTAIDQELVIVAGIAARTCFEMATVYLDDKSPRTFKGKLKHLVSSGLITAEDESNLTLLVEAGNAAAHRGWSPLLRDLDVVISILEHFIERTIYAPLKAKTLANSARSMSSRIPKKSK